MSVTYKTVELNTEHPLTKSEIEVIKEFSLKYPRRDAYLNHEHNKILAYIRQVDLLKFKSHVEYLLQKHGIKEATHFHQLVKEIENIGSYGIKGKKRIFIDFNTERKVKHRKSKEKKRGIYYYAENNTFKTENNELPDRFVNKIICGNSEEVLRELPDNCLDLVFTSPPYNFGLDYHTGEDDVIWQGYFDKLFKIFDECVRTLKYGGRIVVNVQPLFSDYIPSHHIISNFFMKRKLIWKGEILWEKNNYNCKYTAWGSWKSPSNPYFKYTWEFLEVFCKGSLKKEGEKDKADISGDEFKKWVYAKWAIAPERNMKKYGHPAMFPEGLVDRVLKMFSFKNDVILDPFNGVGTTTAVAKRLGRRYLGIDNSEEYCQKAEERLNETLL